MYNPLITEPPMATLAQMQDGTYSIDDVLTMNLLLQYKQDMTPSDN